MDERTPDPSLTDGPLRRRWPLACISSTRCSTGLSVSSFLVLPCRGHVCQNWWWQTFGVRTNCECCSLMGWAKCGFPSKHGRCEWKVSRQKDLRVVPWRHSGKTDHDELVCSVNVKKNLPKWCFLCRHKAWLTLFSGVTSEGQTYITGVVLTVSSTLAQAELKTSAFHLSFIFIFLMFVFLVKRFFISIFILGTSMEDCSWLSGPKSVPTLTLATSQLNLSVPVKVVNFSFWGWTLSGSFRNRGSVMQLHVLWNRGLVGSVVTSSTEDPPGAF